MMVAPTEPISRAQASRIQARFGQALRRAGGGGVFVGEHDLRYTPFTWSPTDMAAMGSGRWPSGSSRPASGCPTRS